jgi:hypothetical protein
MNTLVIKCDVALDSKNDNENIVVEITSNEMVMCAVPALSEFSPHVSQENHSDISLKAQNDALLQIYLE